VGEGDRSVVCVVPGENTDPSTGPTGGVEASEEIVEGVGRLEVEENRLDKGLFGRP